MDKYFIPDIEDIRVGYECEYRVGEKYDWNKHIVEKIYIPIEMGMEYRN